MTIRDELFDQLLAEGRNYDATLRAVLKKYGVKAESAVAEEQASRVVRKANKDALMRTALAKLTEEEKIAIFGVSP